MTYAHHRPRTRHHAMPTVPKMAKFTTDMYAPCFHSVGSDMAPEPKNTALCPEA